MKIVITDADTITGGDLSLEIFSKYGNVTIYGETLPEQLSSRICDADVILCNKTVLMESDLKNSPKLKYIGLFATGYNNIDLQYTKTHGIIVCNAPNYSSQAVTQHVFALIFAICSHIAEYNNSVHDGDWIKSRTFSNFSIPQTEIAGKNIGIIGFGNIGQSVAKAAIAFGMNVYVYTRTVKPMSTVRYVNLSTLLETADFLTLHCPLTDKTRGIINENAIAKMKDGAVLINTARGALVDEIAIAAALKSGKLSAAGLDVLADEPMTPSCPLFKAENCIITPHIAWAPLETRRRLISIAEANLSAYVSGIPQNTIR